MHSLFVVEDRAHSVGVDRPTLGARVAETARGGPLRSGAQPACYANWVVGVVEGKACDVEQLLQVRAGEAE